MFQITDFKNDYLHLDSNLSKNSFNNWHENFNFILFINLNFPVTFKRYSTVHYKISFYNLITKIFEFLVNNEGTKIYFRNYIFAY